MQAVGYAIILLCLTSSFFGGGDACGAPQKRKRSILGSPVKEPAVVEDNGDLLSVFKSLPDYRRLAHAIEVSERRTDEYVKAVYYILSAGLTKKEIHARIQSLLHTAMLTDGELVN
ncbi:hypothetical protein AAVH_39831 [Aphelenchoides avenae]|nr:hypothetical protein AAVH_39831 [Aphelenchus avenae]